MSDFHEPNMSSRKKNQQVFVGNCSLPDLVSSGKKKTISCVSYEVFNYILFLQLYLFFTYFFFFYPILSPRFSCSPYQRGWGCRVWWVSPCVGVSLCVDVPSLSCVVLYLASWWCADQSRSSLWGVRTCWAVSPPFPLLCCCNVVWS